MDMQQVYVVIVFVSLALYFLPALIASGRSHPQRWAIFWLNTLAGWSIIGWVAAFVWSCLPIESTP